MTPEEEDEEDWLFAAEICRSEDNFDDALSVLAWLVRPPRSAVGDEPEIDWLVTDLLAELVSVDHRLNHHVRWLLARNLAQGLGPRASALASRFLVSDRPPKRGPAGDHLARDVLVQTLVRRLQNEGWLSIASACARLADELENLDVQVSVEVLRSAHRNRRIPAIFQSIDLDDLFGEMGEP